MLFTNCKDAGVEVTPPMVGFYRDILEHALWQQRERDRRAADNQVNKDVSQLQRQSQ